MLKIVETYISLNKAHKHLIKQRITHTHTHKSTVPPLVWLWSRWHHVWDKFRTFWMAEVVTHYRVMCYMPLGIDTVCNVHGPTHVGKEMDSFGNWQKSETTCMGMLETLTNTSIFLAGWYLLKGYSCSWMNQSFGTIMYYYKANGNWPKASANHERSPFQKWCLSNVVPQQLFFFGYQLQIAFAGEMRRFFFQRFFHENVHSHPWQRPSWKRKCVTKSVTSQKAGARTATHQQHQTARYPR